LLLLFGAVLVLAMGSNPTVVLGQDATPTGTTACTVSPRDAAATTAMWFDPSGTPLATPQTQTSELTESMLETGTPLDATTTAALDATVREWIACFDQGQYLRAFALMTDDLLREYGPDLSNPSEDTAGEVIALLEGQLAGTPTAGEGGTGATTVAGPRAARLLADGRAGAIWSLGDEEGTGEGFFAFVQQDGQWLIDELVYLTPDGTPEATPAS